MPVHRRHEAALDCAGTTALFPARLVAPVVPTSHQFVCLNLLRSSSERSTLLRTPEFAVHSCRPDYLFCWSNPPTDFNPSFPAWESIAFEICALSWLNMFCCSAVRLTLDNPVRAVSASGYFFSLYRPLA